MSDLCHLKLLVIQLNEYILLMSNSMRFNGENTQKEDQLQSLLIRLGLLLTALNKVQRFDMQKLVQLDFFQTPVKNENLNLYELK